MTGRAALFDFLAILAASLVVVACLLYAQVTGTYDVTTFMVSVVLPLVLGSAILSVRKERILLFAFIAYLPAVVDDAPVFLDSVITWPEVTRFHPFLPRLFMNIIIHAITALFLYLTIRESMKGTSVRLRDAPRSIILTSVAFVLAYAQNIPLVAIQNVVETSWYPFDFTEKLVSIFFLYLAVREATKLKASPAQVGRARIGALIILTESAVTSSSGRSLRVSPAMDSKRIPTRAMNEIAARVHKSAKLRVLRSSARVGVRSSAMVGVERTFLTLISRVSTSSLRLNHDFITFRPACIDLGAYPSSFRAFSQSSSPSWAFFLSF